jgi:hypothetical protein
VNTADLRRLVERRRTSAAVFKARVAATPATSDKAGKRGKGKGKLVKARAAEMRAQSSARQAAITRAGSYAAALGLGVGLRGVEFRGVRSSDPTTRYPMGGGAAL